MMSTTNLATLHHSLETRVPDEEVGERAVGHTDVFGHQERDVLIREEGAVCHEGLCVHKHRC